MIYMIYLKFLNHIIIPRKNSSYKIPLKIKNTGNILYKIHNYKIYRKKSI